MGTQVLPFFLLLSSNNMSWWVGLSREEFWAFIRTYDFHWFKKGKMAYAYDDPFYRRKGNKISYSHNPYAAGFEPVVGISLGRDDPKENSKLEPIPYAEWQHNIDPAHQYDHLGERAAPDDDPYGGIPNDIDGYRTQYLAHLVNYLKYYLALKEKEKKNESNDHGRRTRKKIQLPSTKGRANGKVHKHTTIGSKVRA